MRLLYVLIGLFVEHFGLGEVFDAPYEMVLQPGKLSREPDLLFVSREHADRITPDRLNGPADLVIEIISDSSVTRDREIKFAEYQAAGIPEYWMIDPRPGRQRVLPFALSETGVYEQSGVMRPDATTPLSFPDSGSILLGSGRNHFRNLFHC